MIKVTVALNFSTLHAIGVELKKRIARLQTLKEPLGVVVQDFYATQQAWLDSEGEGTWEPLEPGYAAFKKQWYPGRRVLQRSGRMYAAFVGRNRRGRQVHRDGARVLVTNVPYWLDHHKGRNGMTKRIVLSPRLQVRKRSWSRLVTRYIAGKDFSRRSNKMP